MAIFRMMIARAVGAVTDCDSRDRVVAIRDGAIEVLRANNVKGSVALSEISTDEEDSIPVCLVCRVSIFDYAKATKAINAFLDRVLALETPDVEGLFEEIEL